MIYDSSVTLEEALDEIKIQVSLIITMISGYKHDYKK